MESDSAITGADLHAALHHCIGWGDRLYGVVDTARDSELAFAARDDFGQSIRWLFADDAAWHMTDVAPYLVPIDFHETYPYLGSEYLDMWADRLGRSAGILLITKADPDALWEHLRTIFKLKLENDDRVYYMRFYDPRVLSTYLPARTPDEAREFFGPVGEILMEADAPSKMLFCNLEHGHLAIHEKLVGGQAAPAATEGVRS